MFYKICSDISKVGPQGNIFHNFCRFYRTHYEVLNLRRSCTSKEIKSAFIKLSKEYHPDVNKSQKAHSRFLQINEAYKVLGKPETRRDYDLGLRITNEHPNVQREYHAEADTYSERGFNPQHDPTFWVNRDKSKDNYYRDRPYYGVNGVPRLPNMLIMMFCIMIACLGVGIQYMAITHSPTFRRDDLIRKSLETEKALNATKEAATVNGNMVQLEALRTKLLRIEIKETDNK